MKNGATFEDYIHYVYGTLLNLKGEQVQVSKRTTFRLPHGETYEVDIFYEFVHVGVRHRVAIECKDWKRPVDQGRILEFHQKIKNIGNEVVGVFISRAGYQDGAVRVAERHGIRALTGEDVPSLLQILASSIRATFIPDSRCVGEPFWYIAELSTDPEIEGTGNYYALPEHCPVKIPLFISRTHAEAHRLRLPDKSSWGVFGMPQYKLRALVAFGFKDKLKFGLVVGPPYPDGQIAAMPISAEQLKSDYLLPHYQDGL